MGLIQNLVVRSFECLLRLYPPRFRREFSAEIRTVFLQRMHEAYRVGGLAWFFTALQEMTALALSVSRECWYELWIRKEAEMDTQDLISKDTGSGGAILQRAGGPGSGRTQGLWWVVSWILLTTVVFPAAIVVAPPFAALFLWMLNLGTNAGFWPSVDVSALIGLGFITGVALGMAASQALMLRRVLPRPGIWFALTAASIWLTGLSVWWSYLAKISESWDPFWVIAPVLLSIGLVLGLVQWLYLRRFLPRAIWIIPIDLLAAGSFLLLRPVISTFADLAAFLLTLALPGIITGLGIWLLFKPSPVILPVQTKTVRRKRRIQRIIWSGVMVVTIVPLFFFSLWAYAASHLALAKHEGVYPTVEEAVIGNLSQDFGDAHVVSISSVHAGPNDPYGPPYIWFATARVTYDRVPQGQTRSQFLAGNFYIHVRDGWVFVSEGAFPGFIGSVMELYNMEGVRQFQH
jgi:hypothetical protein